jgi:hypothetical protein
MVSHLKHPRVLLLRMYIHNLSGLYWLLCHEDSCSRLLLRLCYETLRLSLYLLVLGFMESQRTASTVNADRTACNDINIILVSTSLLLKI